MINTVWSVNLDCSASSAPGSALWIASLSPVAPSPSPMGEPLILLGAPNEIFNLVVVSSPGVVPFSVPIPGDPALIRTKWHTQGICPDPLAPFFSNAMDAVIGAF